VTLTRQHTGTISIRGFGFGGSFVTSMLDITFSNGMTCIFSQLEATGGVGTTPGEYICRVGALPKWLGAFTVTVGVRGLVTSGAIAMGTIIADPTIPMSTSRPIATNTEEIEVLGTNFGGNPSVSFSPITCASITKSDGKITCAPNTIPTSLIGSLLNVTVAREDGAQTVYKMPATYCKVGHESFSQNKTFVMQCPAGGSIATINFADYGTPSGSCATGYSSNSMCTSTTTVNPIVAACVGQNSCSFDISNEQFGGDPCEMTPKYFVAQYTCDFGCTEDCFDHVPVGVFVAPPTIKSGPSHIVPNAPSIKFNVEGTLYGPHQVTLSSGAFNEPCTISDSTSSGSGIDFTCTTPTGIPVGAPLTIKFVDTGSGGVATHVIGSVVSAATVYDQSRSIATLATTITLTGSNFFGEPSAFDISINDVICLVHDITSTSLLCDLADPAPALGNPGTAVIVTGTMFGGAFTASIGTLVASHSIEPGNVAASRTDITQLIILGDNIPPENDFTIHLSVFVAARNLTFNDGVCQVVSVNSTAIVCNAGPFLYVGTLYVSLRAYSYDAVQPFGQIVPSPVLRFSGKVAHNSQYFVIQGQDLYSTVTPSVYIYVLADDPAFPNGQDWQAAVDSSYPVYTPPTVVEAYGPTNISFTTELTANHVNSMVIARVVVTTVSSKVIWARVMTVTNPPTVTASSSKFAATATLISITGTGFDDTGAPTSVMLTTEAGSITCGNVVVTSSTSLTCQPVSSLGSGPVSAEVTSYGGASAIVAIGTVVPDPELRFQPSMLRSQNAGFIRFVGSNLPIPGEESSIAIEFASSSSTCSKITAVSTTEILCERAPGSTWTSGPLYATISVYGKSFVAQQVATVVAPPSISSSAGSTRVLVGATELTISGSGFSGGSSKRADGDDIHVYLILPSATEPPTCTVKTVTADVIVCETAGISSEGTLSAIINAHGGNSSQVDVATVSGSSAVVAGAAAGGAIGGVVALALIIVAIIFLVRRNKRQAKVNRAERFRRAATNQSLQEMAAQESSRYSKWSVPHDEIEFGKEIGKGAFGKVYEGTWRGQKVAIKEALITDPTARADFFKEAELMLGLEPHPNVVRIYGVSVVSETSMCYIIMERLYGSFDKILFNPASHSQLKDTDMIEFARGICSGMDHVSNHGIVHRDLASRNILMAKDGTPKISDFGLSRKVSDAATAGTTASNVGPIQWMSPENINREYSSKSDVWSYGCVVYEIVAGQEPHSGRAADLLSLALEIRDNYITPGIPDNSPPVLRNVMEASWKPTPDERASFSELCKLLR
jgi:predicted Ser/Thr protein kinase